MLHGWEGGGGGGIVTLGIDWYITLERGATQGEIEAPHLFSHNSRAVVIGDLNRSV